MGLISGSGRSPREVNGNPLQYSFLENCIDGGVWWAAVHGVTKSQTWLSLRTHTHINTHKSSTSVVLLEEGNYSSSIQFSSVAQLFPTLHDPMDWTELNWMACGFFTTSAAWEAMETLYTSPKIYLAPYTSSIWLFLSYILYNKWGTVSRVLSWFLWVVLPNYYTWGKGSVEPPNYSWSVTSTVNSWDLQLASEMRDSLEGLSLLALGSMLTLGSQCQNLLGEHQVGIQRIWKLVVRVRKKKTKPWVRLDFMLW